MHVDRSSKSIQTECKCLLYYLVGYPPHYLDVRPDYKLLEYIKSIVYTFSHSTRVQGLLKKQC